MSTNSKGSCQVLPGFWAGGAPEFVLSLEVRMGHPQISPWPALLAPENAVIYLLMGWGFSSPKDPAEQKGRLVFSTGRTNLHQELPGCPSAP